MTSCKKKHKKTDSIVKNLPENQGGIGRHKCASCAYEEGYSNGQKHIDGFDKENYIKGLPKSQKKLRRHRDPVEAYELGFFHGQVESSKYLTIKDKKGISNAMRTFALSIIAKGILIVLKNDELPYEHAMGFNQVAHGFEILIKARIVKEHPLLIFDKTSKKEKIKEDSLEFKDLLENGRTIEYSKLPYQLWAVTGYKVEDEELYKKIGFIRNQIVHFHPPVNISLKELTLEYSFTLIEPAVNEWWDTTILKYIKKFNNDCYESLFKKLKKLKISINYEFDKKQGFKKK